MTRDEQWLLDEKYSGEKTEGFFADCKRLKSGEPLAYLIGSIPFLHTTIFLDSHPLIPRTETEFWVERIISEIKTSTNYQPDILDLCAGSGCIGVAVLKELPNSHVDFVEIDTNHHATIQKNMLENSIDQTRTEIFGGNLFEEIHDTYDYILTNPPYIDPIKNSTDENVKKFEPSLALYAKESGTGIISNILEQAPKFLTQQGILVIEHDPLQSELIHTHAKPYGFACTTYLDQFGLKRYTVCVRKEHTNMPQ